MFPFFIEADRNKLI